MLVGTAAEFEREVAAYRFRRFRFEAEALAVARRSVEDAGMLVVGEPHGVAETPAVLYSLAAELGTSALAFEWSHDELGGLVDDLDLDRLWTLPASAEFFSGDGRFTAGHFALVRRLRDERRLDQLILFDRLDPDPHPGDWRLRDREMAERLLSEWGGGPMLVLTGAFHASLQAGTFAAHLARARPGLRPAVLVYEHLPQPPPAPITLQLPAGGPAVLPQSRGGVKT